MIELREKVRSVHKHYERYVYPVMLVLLDYLAVLCAEKGALTLHNCLEGYVGIYNIPWLYFYVLIPLFFLIFLGRSRAYRQMQPIIDTVKEIFYSIMYGLIFSVTCLYFLKVSLLTSRLFVVLFIILLMFFVYMIRYLIYKLMKRFHLFYEPVILIGAGRTAERALRFFETDLGYRYDILGIIDDAPISSLVASRFLLYGNMHDADRIVKDSGVQTVIITAPGMEKDHLKEIIHRVQPYVRDISYVPDLIGTAMAGVEAQVLFTEEILMLRVRNNLARRRDRILKRVFDLVLTICGGVLISPILLSITFLVAIENKGRVIFAHRRVGQHGQMFPCYKFQSMVPDAQERLKEYLEMNPEAKKEWEESFKLTNDPRVTKLGAFLRRTSLDELPQLWNVIRGDMSLVGPRPIVTEEIPRYGDHFREYSMVLPGITGMWQSSGRSDTTYEERVEMDTWYVRNWSVWIDLMYLFKTVKAVFSSKGAY